MYHSTISNNKNHTSKCYKKYTLCIQFFFLCMLIKEILEV